jgi:glycosyltransferase involved in cell wall biosynthesis
MIRTLRIAQVAPLVESVPPRLYGGTERVVSWLTDELVRQGHDVTLFASGDSRTRARLVPAWPRSLRLSGVHDALAPHLLLVEDVISCADRFDIVHFHIGQVHFPALPRMVVPHVTTVHGRLDLPELSPLFDRFADVPLVSISDAQRAPVAQANWLRTVHHGLPERRLRFADGPGSYFAFLGRISPEKRVDRAIAIARACHYRLRIAAKVDPADRNYFEREIRPLLDDPLVEFIGEIGDADKPAFLGAATALLFPIDWPEPFGLVMIEALACGTPVVAFRAGSVAEIIDDHVTGFVVNTLDEAVAAARRVDQLDRRACRRAFEQRFTVERMASDYVSVYRELASGQSANLVA